MANIIQKAAQKAKDTLLGAYHQIYTGDKGQTFRSYNDEEERRRRLQQQRLQQQLAQRAADRQAASAPNAPQISVAKPKAAPRLSISQPQPQPGIRLAVASETSQPKIVIPQVSQPGKTPQKAPQPQPNKDTRNLFQKAWDTVNVTDSGRSWGNANPGKGGKSNFAKVKTFGRETGQSIARTVPNVITSVDQASKSLDNTEPSVSESNRKFMERFRSLSYEERKKRLIKGVTGNGVNRIMLNQYGVDLNDPSDANMDAALKKISSIDKEHKKQVKEDESVYHPGNRVEKFFFGDQPVESYQKRYGGNVEKLKKAGMDEENAQGLAFIGSGLAVGTDLSPGGSGKGNLAKQLAKETDEQVIKKILANRGVQVADAESENIVKSIAKSKGKKEVTKHVDDLIKHNMAADEGLKLAEDRVADSAREQGVKLADDDLQGVRDRIKRQADELRLKTDEAPVRLGGDDASNVLQPSPRLEPIVPRPSPSRVADAADNANPLGGTLRTFNYPDRRPGESDYAYLQRVANEIPAPLQLPEDHSTYFNMGKAHDMLPLSLIDSSKTAAENAIGGTNAPKFMQAARDGLVGKRDPIKVVPTGDGRYRVFDGNGTLTAVSNYGWENVPVEIVNKQHYDAANELARRAEAANAPFQSAMKDAAARLGVEYHEGPVKRVERILEKGVSDYAGDMTKVQDTVRGIMQIHDPRQLDTVLAELNQAGEIARVKNGYDNYTGGYRDIKVNIRTPDGHLSEVILASPEMLQAKNELGGHKLYEIIRSGRDQNGDAALEMADLYRRAAQAEDVRLAASSGDNSLPSTAALSGGNGTPVDTTSPVTSLPSENTLTTLSSTSKNISNGSPDLQSSAYRSSDDINTPSSSIVPENTSVVNDGLGLADNGIKLGDPNAKTPRGFVESVRSNILETPELRAGVKGEYNPINNADTLKAADDIIAADPEAAILRAKTSPDYDTETQAVSLQLLDRLQAAGRTDDAIEIVEAMAERATKAGQATQILAAYNKLTPEGILAAAQREITKAQKLDPIKYKNLKITEEQALKLRTMAEDLKKLPEGSDERRLATRALLNEISKTVPTPGARKFVTLWKAGLLTGVKGAVAGNAVGNTAAAIMRKIADVPAAMLDAALAKVTGQRSKVFTLKGLLGGFGEGIKVGAKNFKEGVGAGDEAIKLDYKKVNFGDGKLGRAAQKYTDTVFNFYSAADRPFYHAALRNNLEELAQVEAKNAGLTGRAAKDYARALVAEPPDHIITQAVEAAEEATFQGKNALGSALSGAKRGLASKGGAGEVAGEVLMPFTGVPAAIAKQVYEYSPANAVVSTYKAIKQAANSEFDQAAQRRLTEALGRSITGTGVLWLGNELHKDGILTLGWPTDPKERALWESEGKQPYSIKIGGKWRSLNYTGSIMSLMAIGGQIDQASKEGGGGAGSIAQGVAASGKAIIGSTPLQGLQGGLDAVTDPERYGEKFVNNTAGSIIPTIVKDVAVANDPLQRQVDNPIDAIQSRIPGARNGLPAKVDVFGNDMPRQTTAIGSIVDPFKSSADRSTPVTQEMRRLQDAKFGVNPPKIDKSATFDGVETKLTPEQITDLTKRTNLKVQEAWKQAIADPSYQALSDEDKSKALSNIASDFAAAERQRYAAEKQLGQYAPDAATNGNKPAKLSGKQDAILNGGFDLSNYTSGTSSKLSQGLTSTSKNTIVKIEGMPAEKRKEYLKDPKNSYQYDLAKYENDLRAGKLSDVDQYKKLQELGTSKVKSSYSKEAVELYGLSKTKLNDFIAKKGGVSQKVLDEVIAMDQQLANEGFISKPKFGGGIGSKSGGGGGGGGGKEKAINVPKPVFGSFRLVEAPNAPAPTMQSVAADLQRMFADIKVLQGIQIAPGSDGSDIKIAV